MKALLTGGAGFIGSHVADEYLAHGIEVVIIDNLSSGLLANIPTGARFYLTDINAAELEKIFAIEKPDFVNHHAAQISVTQSSRDPILDSRVNSQGMLNVLQASVRHGVKKLIFSSTGGAIYGETENLPTPEDAPAQPLSPYGIHKLLGEHYLRYYRWQHGLSYTILRYSNVFGPRQNPHGEAGVVAIFLSAFREGKVPTVFRYPGQPDGMTRDYVFVTDIARANLLALEKAEGQTLNLGTGKETSTGALYRELARRAGVKSEPRWDAARPGDLRRSCLEAGKAESVLGWKPEVELGEGLERTIRSWGE